jgi:DNA anti-recombination protein RmuC
MTDPLTVLAVVASFAALFAVLYLIVYLKKNTTKSQNSDVSEIKGAVSNLNSNLTTVISKIGEIKSSTEQVSNGIKDIQTFADLFKGSSQKRGQTGEIIIRQYLETLPREMWEAQFTLPGSSGRVDYAIRINSNGKQVFLPIDSKFSIPEDGGDFEDEANRRALKRVQEVTQYMIPGTTTDFVVMVLPNPVYYSLKHDTVRSITDQKVLPTPVDGVMILCSLALRAYQAMVLEESAMELRNYAQKIQETLTTILEEVKPLEKNLRSAHRNIVSTREKIGDAIEELDGISKHIDEKKKLETAKVDTTLAPDLLTSVPAPKIEEEN